MYEWENPVSMDRIEIRCADLRREIRRISNVTLRQDFTNPDDRKYWEARLTRLNGELRALESMA